MQKIRRWTNIAKFCYERGCVCADCLYSEILTEKCVAKKSVIESVRALGLPQDIKTPSVLPEFKSDLKAV
jgi:hypothetical protein